MKSSSDIYNGQQAEIQVLNLPKMKFEHISKWILLRSPSYPDPQADRAIHRFVYAFFPHEGDFIAAMTYRKGYELNTELTIFEANKKVCSE